MRINHFVILFLLILMPVILVGDLKAEAYLKAQALKMRYEAILENAVHDGAAALLEDHAGDGRTLDTVRSVQPMRSVDAVLETMALSLGLRSEGQRHQLALYVPCILIIDYDGVYVYGVEKTSDATGDTLYVPVLKPKRPFAMAIGRDVLSFHVNGDVLVYHDSEGQQLLYTLEEAQTLPEFAAYPLSEMRMRVIAETVEDLLNQQVNQHNEWALQNGISYRFLIPQIREDELKNAFSDIGIVAFFQGMTLGGQERLNLYAFGGSRLYKQPTYRGFIQNGIRKFCREECALTVGLTPEAVFHTPQEAAEAGYFPCPVCRP